MAAVVPRVSFKPDSVRVKRKNVLRRQNICRLISIYPGIRDGVSSSESLGRSEHLIKTGRRKIRRK